MDTLAERLFSPDLAGNALVLVALLSLVMPLVWSVQRQEKWDFIAYHGLAAAVGLLAVVRFHGSLDSFVAMQHDITDRWLIRTLAPLSALIYALTWQLVFVKLLPWCSRESDAEPAPLNWRERCMALTLCSSVVYVLLFILAPLPAAMDQALSSVAAQSRQRHAASENAAREQAVVRVERICVAARDLYLHVGRSANSTKQAESSISRLDDWRTGEGLPRFPSSRFHQACTGRLVDRHPAQLRLIAGRVDEVLVELGRLPSPPRHVGRLGDDPPVQAPFAAMDPTLDIGVYMSRALTDPVGQASYALARGDAATTIQLIAEALLLLIVWPLTRSSSSAACSRDD